MKLLIMFVSLFIALYSLNYGADRASGDADSLVDKNRIKADLEFLASDDLEGREAATRNERLAAQYIIASLKKNHIRAFLSDTSYLQRFELEKIEADPNSYLSLRSNAKKEQVLKVQDDYVLSKRFSADTVVKSAEVVFAGYGITAPEFNHDDYKNIDAKGKIVLYMEDMPPDWLRDSSKTNTKYAAYNYKISNAIDHGASGVLAVADSFIAVNWKIYKQYMSHAALRLPSKNPPENFFLIFIRPDAIQKFFGKNIHSTEDLKGLITGKLKPSGLRLSADVRFHCRTSFTNSANVIGIIDGNDPVLKNEYVGISAHYDHLGVSDGMIYNGADDDGSGIVALLETGRILKELKRNKRSILLIFHTAEEKGLLGSEYLTSNLDALKNFSGLINIDMVGRKSIDSIFSIGSDKLSSEMKRIVEDVNSRTSKFVLDYKFDDPNDPERFYYRSDHYNYAKKGIPIVFFYDHMMSDYHKPSDDFDKINYDKIAKIVRLVYNIALNIADLNHKLIIDKRPGS